ncbi:MAG: deoxyribose-phosphate aldolase [Candidatus Coatesbacteria bacterium RBG_13_66_14]|uniref:Deoxyribose-phosphate aldolase n=1 Tax=Candidatus Coatesbacteria bacterium RBG_13_66_14 TaxID=1817816 RepID=A0A1F5F301_9BACT|nr:MAG: deoxyribose-phosphate aldolase [Candidatus Coatesbacteria bacterium RBG_13_66_14]
MPAREFIGRVGREALAWALDGAALDPTVTSAELSDYLDRCALAGIKAVCVLPRHMVEARAGIDDRGFALDLCGVVDFPLGANPPDEKEAEAGRLVAQGADELDAVMSLGLLRAGRNGRVIDELRRLKAVAGPRVLKIIIETPLLTDDQKARAAELCLEAGVDCVKTSTGFHGPTKPADVRLVREVIGSEMDLKAAGGIRTLEDAALFFEAGANRIGARTAPDIMAEFDRLRGRETYGFDV